MKFGQNLRNLTEEMPAWPSKTAANENPWRPSERTTTASSISSRPPCKLVEPHRIPAISLNEEDWASMAMAEQLRILAAFTVTRLLLFLLVVMDLEEEEERLLYSFAINLCNCWLSKAIFALLLLTKLLILLPLSLGSTESERVQKVSDGINGDGGG